jgi:hypothetical protein
LLSAQPLQVLALRCHLAATVLHCWKAVLAGGSVALLLSLLGAVPLEPVGLPRSQVVSGARVVLYLLCPLMLRNTAGTCLSAVALARAAPLAPWRWRLAPRLLARPVTCLLAPLRQARSVLLPGLELASVRQVVLCASLLVALLPVARSVLLLAMRNPRVLDICLLPVGLAPAVAAGRSHLSQRLPKNAPVVLRLGLRLPRTCLVLLCSKREIPQNRLAMRRFPLAQGL